MYTLQPISSSVPNPSGGQRMDDYAFRASGAAQQVAQAAPGLFS